MIEKLKIQSGNTPTGEYSADVLHREGVESSSLDVISTALGPPPMASYAAAHAYPEAAPAFVSQPFAERPGCPSGKLRLYLHIPFCNYSCSFCFFAIRVTKDQEPMQRYVQALKKELEWIDEGTILSQLFVGGGTPTTLPPHLLDEVLAYVFARTMQDGTEVHTVEASPDSLTADHVRVLQRHGIGRVSMGIQTFNPELLERVQRRHDAAQAHSACRLLLDSGLIVNTDLMYGLPGQSQQDFADDFDSLAKLGVQSATVYDLRLNENTPVSRVIGEEEKLEIARLVRWRQFVRKVAEDLGYTQTRWHTFKRMDTIAASHERAAHHGPDGQGFQFGAGMSARSQLGHTVYRNHANMNVYIDRVNAGQSPVEGVIALREEDRKTQFIARSLGDGKPLRRDDYENAFKVAIDHDFGAVLQRLSGAELIADDGESLNLTETGRLVHDRVTYNFYPPHALEWLAQRQQLAAVK
jgi:oxygen-independent coproporphyrinogen-3 oxidase